MARRRASRRAQRGIALLGLLAVAVMVFAYVLTSRLNAASQFVGIDREHNAKVLAQAKRALIGYMAQQAAMAGENNPGRLPCPEAPAFFGDPAQEGIAAGNCTLPAVGRLPWRTLGLERLVDAAGEPLWYVVSPGWALSNSTTPPLQTVINLNSIGQLTLDGVPNDAVALIIAPGPPLSVQAGAGCTAWAQTRPTVGPPDLRNYLECGNTATNFVTSALGNSFNDQVLRVAATDVLPALDAVIADRMRREIAPALKAAAYTSAQYAGIPAGALLYPYPVMPFTDPSTSGYLGVAGNSNPQGLLPFNQISGTCAAPPPCTTLSVSHPHSVRSTLYGYIISYSCSTSATEILCQGQYHEDTSDSTRNVRIEMAATFGNVAMGFRALDASPVSQTLVEARDDGATGAWETPTPSIVEYRMNDGTTSLPDGTVPPRGSVTIRFRATLPNIDVYSWGTQADFRIRINRAVFDDQALLKKNDPTLGWFVRNEWYRYTYYAVAKSNTADWLPSLGCTSANCVRLNDPATNNIRALLIYVGGPLSTQSRPSNSPIDYVENQNADLGTLYEQRLLRRTSIAGNPNAPWNDRVFLVDWDSSNPPVPSSSGPQVVSLTPVRVYALP